MSVIVDGKALAAKIRSGVLEEVNKVHQNGGEIVFAAVIVGNDPSSKIYIETKRKACAEAGIKMRTYELPESTVQDGLNKLLSGLSRNKKVNGVLLQLPLPVGLSAKDALACIDPKKDVDGITSENFGALAAECPVIVPCTAAGILHILKTHNVNLSGAEVVIIGRSNIVGKPAALLLARENATVTLCHKQTRNLAAHTKRADIIIVAAGHAKLVTADMVKKDAVVIDVGINRSADRKICGDVDFEKVSKKTSVITPVPGGVGPLTIAFLLGNIITAYKLQQGGGGNV